MEPSFISGQLISTFKNVGSEFMIFFWSNCSSDFVQMDDPLYLWNSKNSHASYVQTCEHESYFVLDKEKNYTVTLKES